MKPKKKKEKQTAPKRATVKRPRRLQMAKEWIVTYTGKHLVRAYAKRYRVDLHCSIKELRLLNIEVSEQYEQAVKHTLEALAVQKKQKQEEKQLEDSGLTEYSDWDFAFIAGYTSGGAPYGIRWDEMPPEDQDED
jgi:hypothetical protein